MDKLDIKIEAKAGAGNKLFGSVGTIDLEAALSKKLGNLLTANVLNWLVVLLKRLGEHTANIRLHREVYASLTFDVIKKLQRKIKIC